LIASDQPHLVDPYHLAVVHAGLGDRDLAFRCLEGAYRYHSLWLAGWARCDPRLDPLRGDARFADLLRRLGVL
jgi:hypothetical protein